MASFDRKLSKILKKLNKLKPWQASLIIFILGFAAYFDGLRNQFIGDDNGQIVNNPVVHSITNIRLFFDGGTFYIGKGIAPLYGVYFRPLMTTVFSIIYTLFGAHSFYFHLAQMLLCIGSAIILYLLFKVFFKPALALFLALIFLLHPVNSEVVFALSSMQDALFFFFGILGLYLLVHLKSTRSLLLVALCMLLSLFAKETGLLFIVMSILYLAWWDRKRLKYFAGSIVLPIALWLVLKIHAIGLLGTNPHNAPIDNLSLGGRLMTDPSIILFYISKFIFPWRLAYNYYWVHPTFSLRYFLLPLLIDLGVLALIIFLALRIRRKASKKMSLTYIFFAIWTGLGLILSLQLVPLDTTVSEYWFYFPMVGVLGMIGVIISSFSILKTIDKRIPIGIAVAVLVLLGVRTAIRGPNWSSPYTIASYEIVASPSDYNAYNTIAGQLVNEGKYSEAGKYAQQSIGILPSSKGYDLLGRSEEAQGNYSEAINDYVKYFDYGGNNDFENAESVYENLGTLELIEAKPSVNVTYLEYALSKEPRDSVLWAYLAIAEFANKNSSAAKESISEAVKYGPVPAEVYYGIMNNQPFTLNLKQINKSIYVQ